VGAQSQYRDGDPDRSRNPGRGGCYTDRYRSGTERDRGSDQAAWVANEDGTLSRIDDRATSADSLWVGAAVREIALGAGRVWVATTALDQQLPGGG
jgi:hypothetical protein